MESLALLVAIILAISYFAGPLALLATKLPSKKPIWIIGRRILVLVLSLAGIEFSLQLMFAKIPLVPKLFSLIGFGFAVAALRVEWRRFKHNSTN